MNMKTINGVSFRDYACANANIVAGMPVEKVCEILGIEIPVWEDTVQKWNDKMAELSPEDMAFYGEVFTNPKQGKFADVEVATDSNSALDKVPDIETYAKISAHMSIADDHGVDGVSILENEYGLNLIEWTKAGKHYGDLIRSSNDSLENFEKYLKPFGEADKKWRAYFSDKYKDSQVDLSNDIDF